MGCPADAALDVEKRQQLEKRIAQLEERLREMERRLQRRQRTSDRLRQSDAGGRFLAGSGCALSGRARRRRQTGPNPAATSPPKRIDMAAR